MLAPECHINDLKRKSMSESTGQKPQCFSIDVDQWRREIRIFAESTEQAIEAIVAEYSDDSKAGGVESKNETSGHWADEFSNDDSEKKRSHRGGGSSDRLALLKEQLAQRLSKK